MEMSKMQLLLWQESRNSMRDRYTSSALPSPDTRDRDQGELCVGLCAYPRTWEAEASGVL